MTNNFLPEIFQNFEPKTNENITEWGKTIVFAPHPDDESLGCGGAIALLRKSGLPVTVVAMSDGTLSHPNSNKFPANKLRELREKEMLNALEILGVCAEEIKFLRYRDRAVPNKSGTDFSAAIENVKKILAAEKPQMILAPWRFDPHPDHRATWQIVKRAVESINYQARLLEYPIWLWELAENSDLPNEKDFRVRLLNIESVAEIKQKAIRAHASQITDLIDDDPQGFRLSAEVLEHFAAPFEIYLEKIK